MNPKTVTIFDFLSGRSIRVGREVAAIRGAKSGPNLLFVAGLHDHDPIAMLALHRVLGRIMRLRPLIRGNVFGLVGNLTHPNFRGDAHSGDFPNIFPGPTKSDRASREIIHHMEDQMGLWSQMDRLIASQGRPFVIVELRTAGVEGTPFITMPYVASHGRIARRTPVPVVAGTGEIWGEPLLGHFCGRGHSVVSFDAGYRGSPEAIRNHEAMIWLTLVNAGVIRKIEIPQFKNHYHLLKSHSGGNRCIFQAVSNIPAGELGGFVLRRDLRNFGPVEKDEILGSEKKLPLSAPRRGWFYAVPHPSGSGRSLYILDRISQFRLFRDFALGRLLPVSLLSVLPGVRPCRHIGAVLELDRSAAGKFTPALLRLLGYRKDPHCTDRTLYHLA